MVIDFSKIDLKEQPVLVLRNLDGTAIQTLGYAFNLKGDLCYDEISNITFDLPAYVEGEKTPHYDDVVGTRIIDMLGYGQFILINPNVKKEGVKEIKSCKAYSLEYELTYKKLSITEGTYNFWNPVAPDETIIGIILSYLPSWSVGSIDDTLIGKYRTFSVNGENIYNFIKSTVQKTYDCIFEFDTYQRKINVRATSSKIATAPVFISLDNLAKSISLEEDTENIFTVLDVNGADGVTIRSVNPMGTNKIYNLDYYMNESYFSADIILKWQEWKQSYQNYQLTYYNITIEKMLKTAAIVTEENRLRELSDAELKSLENRRSVLVEYLASTSKKNNDVYEQYQDELNTVNSQIKQKNKEISECKDIIKVLNTEKDTLNEELVAINKATAFSNYFSEEEIVVLNRYFKEDSIADSSFVVAATETYTEDDVARNIADTKFVFTGGNVIKTMPTDEKEVFSIEGGTVSANGDVAFTANVIRASIECKNTGEFVLSGYLGNGILLDHKFVGGCISLTGNCEAVEGDIIPDLDIGDAYQTGTKLSFYTDSARLYFTRNTTEYERFSVEWELYEYGCEGLNRLAYPSYTFDVTAANFFALDEFESFANKLELGNKLYLDTGEDNVLQPIFVGVSIEFEKLASLKLKFGNKFSIADSAFSLADLLDKSVSMGKTVDTGRFNYNSFIDSGAATTVKSFIDSALDVSKNAVLSGENMAVSWDSSGIHCRKWTADGTGYEPEQIAIINNNIIFTDDGWQSAKMAIGRFSDTNLGDVWGVVAPNIVGTLLAGSNLVIESVKQDGGVSVFRVDADGAVLHNARFDIVNNSSHIVLDPSLGFGIGTYPMIMQKDGVDAWNEDDAKFWVDTEGNIHFKGSLEGCDGKFSGTLEGSTIVGGSIDIGDSNFVVDESGNLTANKGTFKGTISGAVYLDSKGKNMMNSSKQFTANYLSLYGLEITDEKGNTTFEIDSSGNVSIRGDIYLGSGSTINWSAMGLDDPIDVANEAAEYVNELTGDVEAIIDGRKPSSITGTFISGRNITSPTIMGGLIQGAMLVGNDIFWGEWDENDEEVGITYGSLTHTTGSDGVKPTDIIKIFSNEGLVLEAETNMRFEGNSLWINMSAEDVNVQYNNEYMNLIELIEYLIYNNT